MTIEELRRVEELKHHEQLLFNTIGILEGVLCNHNIGYETEKELFEKAGFTKNDFEYFGILDDIYNWED